MSFQDRLLYCSTCGTQFTFSAEKQEFFKIWGYTDEPKHCPSCSRAQKSTRCGTSSYSNGTHRQLFRATCAECGKITEVPFEPRAGRRVYCRDCYRSVKLYR